MKVLSTTATMMIAPRKPLNTVSGRVDQHQDIVDHVEECCAEHHAEDGAAAAEEADAADDHGGDGLQLEAAQRGEGRLDLVDAGALENAGEAGGDRTDDEGDDLHPVDRDADGDGGVAVAAGGEEVVAEAMAVEEGR